jgi:hypothetical protein
MELQNFLQADRRVTKITVRVFPNLPPQVVLLTLPDGQEARIRCVMHERSPRSEYGVLTIEIGNSHQQQPGEDVVVTGNATIRGCELWSGPGLTTVSGFKLSLDVGELVVTTGTIPYSLYIQHENRCWGDPEFEISQYTSEIIA